MTRAALRSVTALLAAFELAVVVAPVRAQASGATPSGAPRASRFMRFPAANAPQPATPDSEPAPRAPDEAATDAAGGPVAAELAKHPPIPATLDAALLRMRLWAAGRGPTGAIAATSGDAAWCDAALCPLVDGVETALTRGDGRAALAAVEKARAALLHAVADPCDRRAGEAALAQLECEARARLEGARARVFCVTRGDDPLAGETRIDGCTEHLCEDADLLETASGTLRWAVCQANNVPDREPAPRIHFALEPARCDAGLASFAPIELGGAPVTVLRAATVIDGYSQPGAMHGDLAARRAPLGLPAITASASAPTDGRESVVPLLEIAAPDVEVRGLAFDEPPGRAALLVDRRGAADRRCGAGGRGAWIHGNVFRGLGHTAVFVGGPAGRFGRKPEIAEIGGVVVGARADRPDPADLNVFQGEEPNAVLVSRASGVRSRAALPRVVDAQVRGNWFAEPAMSRTLGIFLHDTDDAVIECNLLGAVHAGVAVVAGRGTEIRRNLFEGTLSPVKLTGGAARVTVGGVGAGAAGGGGAAASGGTKRVKEDDALAKVCPVAGPGNRIEAPDEGIELDGPVDDVAIVGNEIHGGFETAISVHPGPLGAAARRTRIEANRIDDSVAGIRVSGGDVQVLANVVRGSRGYGLEVTGTHLAALEPPLGAHVRVGSAERPNTFERNGAGAILITDTELVNQREVGHENRFVENQGPHVMAGFRGLLRLVDGDGAPLVGARISIDAENWLGPVIEATSDDQGLVGVARIDPDDPLTWPLVPTWAEVEPTDLPPDLSPGGTPPASKRLEWTPGRVRLQLADRVVTLPLSWDPRQRMPGMDGVTVTERCVGAAGADCEGGMRLLRAITIDTARISSSYPAQ